MTTEKQVHSETVMLMYLDYTDKKSLTYRQDGEKGKTMKNIILKTISNIALIMMMIFICSMDSPNIIIPIVGMIVCGAWLILFYTVNEDKLLEEE